MDNEIIIAIDGHSSCGKSTLAKDLAERLNYIYVDTGAMYRAVALLAERSGLVEHNELIDSSKLKALLSHISIAFERDQDGRLITLLNGENVEQEIRNMRISNMVSHISSFDFVREKLVKIQQQLGEQKGIVMDGRDIGTVVFPQAELKIFLTARPEIRAERRYQELIAKGENVRFEEVLENVKSRDHLDETREISPLRQAKDAIVLDNSELTPQEQLEYVLDKIK